MATTEELFISVSPQSYKRGKSSVLLSQAELLRTMKHLQNIKTLSRQKNDLKIKFNKLLISVIKKTHSLQKKLPTSHLPEIVSSHKHEAPQATFKVKKTFSKRDEIDEELKIIQEKLAKLNS